MSLGHIGTISLEHVNLNKIGDIHYVEIWYNSHYPYNYTNYLIHEDRNDIYIKWGLGNLRAKLFVGEL